MTTPTVTGQRLLADYLASLHEASPSTVRQRRWAGTDLLTFATTETNEPAASDMLSAATLEAWLADARTAGASLPSLRARAATARALDAYARTHHLVDGAASPASTRLPKPARTPRATRGARHLLFATTDVAPWPVHPQVWDRFGAHVHVLAVTGAREADLARVCVSDLDLRVGAVRVGGTWCDLPDVARHVTARWLATRTRLVAALDGTDPEALWVRVHPAVHPRTGVLAPAGLPIGVRGLRKAFTQVTATLAESDPLLPAVTVADVRALGRDDGPLPS